MNAATVLTNPIPDQRAKPQCVEPSLDGLFTIRWDLNDKGSSGGFPIRYQDLWPASSVKESAPPEKTLSASNSCNEAESR